MSQSDLPGVEWSRFEIPSIVVTDLWKGSKTMFLAKHLELLPWN